MIRAYTRILAIGLTFALWLVAVGMTWLFLDVASLPDSRPHIPNRPDTGNHGQGHSATAQCPGQYKEPVDVDGVEYPLTCFGKSTYFFNADNSGIAAKFTTKTLLVTAGAKDALLGTVVVVPAMSNYVPVICFALTGKRAVECLYVDRTSGNVQQRQVILDKEST